MSDVPSVPRGDVVLLYVSGLKCDAPGCDYVDNDIDHSDYEKYVDTPCPKCGANLLTRADYETTNALMKGIEGLNKVLCDLLDPEYVEELKTSDDVIMVHGRLDMDGSGTVRVGEVFVHDPDET